ncbi:MAG: DUF4234 domain-containing protein [Candidatus Alcyoniella australis]|nr:DUF4234 domain-containing protein [Candidatus Alcyoniella australis]
MPVAPQPVTVVTGPKPVGAIRSPGIVILLILVTCGIYGIVYYYKTFEELRNWRGQGWSGGLYLLFTFLLPFMTFAIPWLLPAYIGRMYAEDGQPKPITGNSGWWILVPIAGGIIWLVVLQNRLNEFWASKGAQA